LESVLGVVAIANHPTAHGKHHWPMSLDKGLKSRFVSPLQEPFKELPVCLGCALFVER
jgi:hypothetical protein